MTKEEIKSGLSALATQFPPFSEENKLILGAVEVLDQESYEDCISREAARDLMYHKQEPLDEYDLDTLPSVTPQPKTGYWIELYQGDEIINYCCSECELGDTNGSTNLYGWDYCRRCGARMVEPQERSDKE